MHGCSNVFERLAAVVELCRLDEVNERSLCHGVDCELSCRAAVYACW